MVSKHFRSSSRSEHVWRPHEARNPEYVSGSCDLPSIAGKLLLLWPPMQGKLVHVASRESELDLSAVSATVDLDPQAHQGRPVPGHGVIHGWHAALIHHHSRCHLCVEQFGARCFFDPMLVRDVCLVFTRDDCFRYSTTVCWLV